MEDTELGRTALGDTEATSGKSLQRREALSKGSPLGRYVVIDKLGSGGMGVVYSAYDPDLGRRVAIKLLHPSEPETWL